MNKVFFCLAATVVLVARATVGVAQVVLPPDQIMRPHPDAGDRLALWLAGAAGMVAVLSGLMNFYVVFWGHQPPAAAAPAPTSRRQRADGLPVTKPVIPSRYSISQGALFVVLGSYFVWLTLIYGQPQVQQQSLQQQHEYLHRYLSKDSVATMMPPGLFLSYVRAGAVGLNEDLGNGTMLASLVEAHRPDTVRTLLAAGAAADTHPPGQYTPLLLAIGNFDVADVRLLLAAGANPSLAADNLPIFDAVYPAPSEDSIAISPRRAEARRQIVAALVAAGAQLNVRDDSYTPLMLAAANGQCDLLPVLLAGHPDRTLRLKTGETALDLAVAQHPECAPLLRAAHPAPPTGLLPALPPLRPAPLAVRAAGDTITFNHQEYTRWQAAAVAQQARDHHEEYPYGWFGTHVAGALFNFLLSVVLSALLYFLHRAYRFVRGDHQPVDWEWIGVSSGSSTSSSSDDGSSDSEGAAGGGGESGGGGASGKW